MPLLSRRSAEEAAPADEPASPGEAVPPGEAASGVRPLEARGPWIGVAGAMVAAVVLARSGDAGLEALASWVVIGVAIPLVLFAGRGLLSGLTSSFGERVVLVCAVLAVAAPLLGQLDHRLTEVEGTKQVAHDGGVIATRAAAEDVLEGRNPYAADHRDDLPPWWDRIELPEAAPVANPLDEVYPYLPGAFLVAVPGAFAAGAIGIAADPRILMLAVFAATVAVILRRPEPAWARAATVLATGSTLTTLFLSWGTNDTVAACGVVLAGLLAGRRPRLAASLLALAVSFKVLVVLAVIPLALRVTRNQGVAGLRAWWPLPAILGATTLPFLLWAPVDLVGDTLGFWAGFSEHAVPPSGYGLPVQVGGLISGSVSVVTALITGAAGVAAAIALTRRIDHPAIVPVATAAAVLGVLVSARSFQANYLALLSMLAAPGWLAVGARFAVGDRLGRGAWQAEAVPAR